MVLTHEQWKALQCLASGPKTLQEIRSLGVTIAQSRLSDMTSELKMNGLQLVKRQRVPRKSEEPKTSLMSHLEGWQETRVRQRSVYEITAKGREVLRDAGRLA